MEYLDNINGYKVYRNSDGLLEGWKTTGEVNDKKQASGSAAGRLVTTCKTLEEFAKLTEKKTKLKPKQDKPPELFI